MNTIPFLALKDIVKDKRIVALVIFLLAFSYVNMTFLPAFLNGLSDTFENEVVDTVTSHILIEPRTESNQQYLSFESSIRKKIELVPGVVATSAHISVSGTILYNEKEMGVPIKGIKPSEDMQVTTIDKKLVKGQYLEDDDVDEVILGEVIAGRKIEDRIGKDTGFGTVTEGLGGVDVGETVKIRFSNGVVKEYRVKGIVGSEGFSPISQTVYLTKKEVEDVLGISDKASSILVKLNEKDDADKYKRLILELGLPGAEVKTWKEATSFVEGINQTFGIVISITTMVGIIIVLATVGIVVFINVSRKRRIIGVLKSIGMKNDQILMVFLFQSIIFGILGTLLGIFLTYSIIFYMTLYPIPLPIGFLTPVLPTETAINAVIILILSSVIAGYVPARTASRQGLLESIKTVE